MMCCEGKYLIVLFITFIGHLNANKQDERISIPGDLIIAGLSPVHYPPSDIKEQIPGSLHHCGGSFNVRGLQHVEAIVYAINKINANRSLLPGIRLGADIRDTCNSVDQAIRETLEFTFVKDAYRGNTDEECTREKKVAKTIALVGAAYSDITIAVTNLAQLFYVPVVSYASTSRLLSDQTRFKYFLRTVSQDTIQTKAIVDIVKHFGWNFVHTIASDTAYGRSGIDAFKQTVNSLKDYHICIAVDEVFTIATQRETLKSIIHKMRENTNAKVIVLFAELNGAQYFIDVAKEENFTGYIWIGSDAWAASYRVLYGHEKVLEHVIAVAPKSTQLQEFVDFFKEECLREDPRGRNPWMRKYKEHVGCENENKSLDISPYISNAVDAVYAVAHGLHNMLNCSEHQDNPCFTNETSINLKTLYRSIRNSRFVSPTGNLISFDDSGCVLASYDVIYLKKHQRTTSLFETIGEWNSSVGLTLNERWSWKIGNADKERSFPPSTCSQRCYPGTRKEPHTTFPKCCWECIACAGNTITNQSGFSNCYTCPDGFRTNKNHSLCEPIEPTVLNLIELPGVLILIACALGILAVVVVSIVFIIHHKTPVIRASSKHASIFLLIGIAWCYGVPIMHIIALQEHLCDFVPFINGIGIALAVGSMLTKTNRIARIFSIKALRAGQLSFLSNRWQVAFVFFCVAIEIIISLGWVVMYPMEIKQIPYGAEQVTLECKDERKIGFAIWIAYNAGLIFLCSYQAFLIRKVPENYNEAKFISFTMLAVCVSGAVYIPAYLGTDGLYRTMLSCFLFIFCSTAALGCIFGPKVYIVLFRPEKNKPMQPRASVVTNPYRMKYCNKLKVVVDENTLQVNL